MRKGEKTGKPDRFDQMRRNPTYSTVIVGRRWNAALTKPPIPPLTGHVNRQTTKDYFPIVAQFIGLVKGSHSLADLSRRLPGRCLGPAGQAAFRIPFLSASYSAIRLPCKGTPHSEIYFQWLIIFFAASFRAAPARSSFPSFSNRGSRAVIRVSRASQSMSQRMSPGFFVFLL